MLFEVGADVGAVLLDDIRGVEAVARDAHDASVAFELLDGLAGDGQLNAQVGGEGAQIGRRTRGLLQRVGDGFGGVAFDLAGAGARLGVADLAVAERYRATARGFLDDRVEAGGCGGGSGPGAG